MPKKAKAAPVQAPPMGHVIKPRYREFKCDWFDLDEGEEPFKATLRCNLSFDEVNALPAISSLTYAEVWEHLFPHVKAWNLLAYNHASGELEPVPAPMDAGVDVFRATDPAYTQWLYMTLMLAHQGGINGAIERKNASGPSESGPPPGNDSDSETTA